MTVNLIVPVYKAEPWIEQCMESIRAQTYKDIELIVIDDAEGTGAAAARNRGLDKATGEFIAFCDADDYLEPAAIEAMVKAMEGVGMVAGSFRKVGLFSETVQHNAEMNLSEVAAYTMSNMLNPRSNQMLCGCCAKLFRRSLVDRFPLITTAEDMAFNFDYLTRCRLVRFIPDIVYNARKRKGSVTTTFDESNKSGLFGFLEGLKYVERFLKPFFSEQEIRDATDNSKVYHSALYFMRICADTGLPMNDAFKKLYP